MADKIVKLLEANYDEKYGVVNMRPVVDRLLRESQNAFADVATGFGTVERRWRQPLLEAMRTLAASGYCNAEDARTVLVATGSIALERGVGEYFRTINALASSKGAAAALPDFLASLLARPTDELVPSAEEPAEFRRRLAFYVLGTILEHGTTDIPEDTWLRLKAAASLEPSELRREQFLELLERSQPGRAAEDEARTSTVVRAARGEIQVVEPRGAITVGWRSRELRRTINVLVAEGKRKFVIDLKDVTTIDSTGLGILLSCVEYVRSNGGEVKLVTFRRAIREVLDVMKLTSDFEIYKSELEAIASFSV
jgi:anti-sigma B factor antagonist